MRKAKGYAWEVRFSEWLNGKRYQRSMTLQGTEYPKEADVRKAIELTVSQINSRTLAGLRHLPAASREQVAQQPQR